MKKLKNIFRVLLIVCVVVLASCKDDENDNKLQTIIATVPIGTPTFDGADIYFVGDVNEWKVLPEFKMTSFPYTVDKPANATIAGRKYQITLTNLPQGEYKYVVVVDGKEYFEGATHPADSVKGHTDDVPNHKLNNLRAINDTIASWKGITVDGQLAHKFAVTAPKVEGDVYMVGTMNEFKVTDAYKLNREASKPDDTEYKYSITIPDMVEGHEYYYVLVVNGTEHKERAAAPPSTVCADEAKNRKIGLYNVRVSETVGNWEGVTTCLTPEAEEPETE
jgi:hypothetical protein